jgi:hypothetical protein
MWHPVLVADSQSAGGFLDIPLGQAFGQLTQETMLKRGIEIESHIVLLFKVSATPSDPRIKAFGLNPETIIVRQLFGPSPPEWATFVGRKVWTLGAMDSFVGPGNLGVEDGALVGQRLYALAGDISKEAFRNAKDDHGIASFAMAQFCLTVNCENGGHETIPAPAALNKKRGGRGQVPMYSYRVLTIPGDRGAHAGPAIGRLHLGRGHLRRLQSGKVTWVRHCTVGNPDRGVAEKQYSVKA